MGCVSSTAASSNNTDTLGTREDVDTGCVQYRVGEWLPSDQAILQKWLEKHIEEVDGIIGSPQADSQDDDDDQPDVSYPLHPVVQQFKESIEGNPEITMLFHQMFSEIPESYQKTPNAKCQVRNYHHMLKLQLINHILRKAPEFNETGLVGFPINAILDWPMGTIGGYAAFLNINVNHHPKNILNEWGTFLKSPASCYVLNEVAW